MFILDLPVPENCFDCYLLCDEMERCLLFDGVPAHAHADREKRPDWCPIICDVNIRKQLGRIYNEGNDEQQNNR